MKSFILVNLFLIIFSLSLSAFAKAPTKVGNGDDGSDLEGFIKVTSGPIFESRQKAIIRLRQLNINGIKGLGFLLPEVEKSSLYITKSDIKEKDLEKMGGFHSSMGGYIYARTFPRRHAATRFFPVTKKLTQQQMIALHIHEALHRALPKEIREDEQKVAKLTLAIVDPESSFDSVAEVSTKILPQPVYATNLGSLSPAAKLRKPIPNHARINRPSTLELSHEVFMGSKNENLKYSIGNLSTLSSQLYPFGEGDEAIGIGIRFGYIKVNDDYELGPMQISGRMRLWTVREFDIDGYAEYSAQTKSDAELLNSYLGRDTTKIGIFIFKKLKFGYVENNLHYFLESSTDKVMAGDSFSHTIAPIVNAGIRFGVLMGSLNLGLNTQLYLADNYSVKSLSTNWTNESGRYRLLTVGPEIAWEENDWGVKAYGSFLVDSTKDINLDQLGDVLGAGAGQGRVGVNLSFKF